jgi:hypothetical protein
MMTEQSRVTAHSRWDTSRTEFVNCFLTPAMNDPFSDCRIEFVVTGNATFTSCKLDIPSKIFTTEHLRKGKPLLGTRNADGQPLTFINGLVHTLRSSMGRPISLSAHNESISEEFKHRLS